MHTHIDLHSHTHYSDGELSPRDLISCAKQKGITTLAITDHDTLAGVFEAKQAAKEFMVNLIPGVEISVTWQGKSIHLVGLNVDVDNSTLQKGLEKLLSIRVERAKMIASQLSELGIENSFEEVSQLAKFNNISRNHFACHLLKKNVAKDFNQAFKRYLMNGRPGYVSVTWASLSEAIEWIKGAQGVAVIAHPTRYKLTHTQLVSLVKEFKEAGGDALEVITASTQFDEIRRMSRLCREFNLLASLGSDYHGPTTWAKMGNLKQIPENCQPVWSLWSEDDAVFFNTSG